MKRSTMQIVLKCAALAVLLMLAGCAKKATEAPPTPSAPPPTNTAPPTPSQPAQPETPAPSAPAPTSGAISDLKPVFFDYDSDALRDDARSALDGNAKVLRDNGTLSLVIEGHCDERGTEEYNQALGERRANAARDYLVSAGIPVGRLRVISYGKARPFAEGHDESAWAQNRRAQFVAP
jgi:peptidoglycan-associated lipoprotein